MGSIFSNLVTEGDRIKLGEEKSEVIEARKDNEKVLRPTMDNEDSALPLPQSLQESLDLLKKDELLLSILGDDLSTAYIAVRELEVSSDTTLEDEIFAALKA